MPVCVAAAPLVAARKTQAVARLRAAAPSVGSELRRRAASRGNSGGRSSLWPSACRPVAAEPAFGRRARVAPACIEHLGGRCLMGAVGCRGAFGVTLQFALALRTRGFCATVRELNLARRRRRAPWLLGTASEIRLRTGRRDRSDHRPQVTSDELRADAKSAVARTCELAIPAPVSARPTHVIAAIDLDDQAG